MQDKAEEKNGAEVGGENHPHVLLLWHRQQPIWRRRQGEPEAAPVWEEEEHQLAVGGAGPAQGERPALC